MGPLDGITVVALEQAVAAPFCTRQLADLGARVIKVERPGVGDFARSYDRTVLGQSSHFVWLNRSKESLTLDIKQPAALEVLHRLLAAADVFIQNLGPGATARLGLAATELSQKYPRLIVCDVTGYGLDGPWADRKAYDALVQCETGVVALTGSPSAPAKAGISIADIAGGMYAYTGILTALYRRATTGEVGPVEVALFDALSEWMGAPAYFTGYGGTEPERVGAEHATIVPYGPFTAANGVTVLLAIQNEREWASLCAVFLASPELATRYPDNPSRLAHRDEVNALVSQRFAQLTGTEAVALLEASRVAYAHLNTVQEYLSHPVLSGRDRWRSVATPNGPVRALLPPATLPGVPSRMDAVPALGEHTDAILGELHYTPAEVARLHSLGAA
jgi:crotonobetainyl-CoA:carnitine CoA-transferase CaiB-like acyl-CoA transferase